MSVHKVEMKEGEEPYKWKVIKVADIGGDEEFTKQLLELTTVLEAGMILGPQREEVKHAIASILIDGLMPAFLKLEEIRASVGRAIPLMNLEQLYEDFARKLWKAYKELMQVTLDLMGHKIRFLFQGEKEFREGLVELRRANPISGLGSKTSWKKPETNGRTILGNSGTHGSSINEVTGNTFRNSTIRRMRSGYSIRFGAPSRIFCRCFWNSTYRMEHGSSSNTLMIRGHVGDGDFGINLLRRTN